MQKKSMPEICVVFKVAFAIYMNKEYLNLQVDSSVFAPSVAAALLPTAIPGRLSLLPKFLNKTHKS